ncbi:hypothetical protein [Caulobacter sp. 17J80-11]|uniref:F0F1 ATP synthase subunit B family protein n=1 Tax=Caulobacter sp. 17J80-11 TaxID=2763502 RepID=UPI001653AFE9|nr:hypothetical protein [Caulobacter sp. 17J80-11]MBC6982294.1 hypothetical protein [Caulobacter sp. 17J80-11]
MATAPEALAPEAAQDVHETVGHAEAEGHGGGGLPQLQFEHWAGQIVWLLLIFAIVYFALAKLFVPKMRGAIDARGSKIAEDLANARALRDEAEAQAKAAAAEMAEARGRAQRTAADAKARAAAESAKRQAAEEAVLNARLDEAETRIRKARDKAMKNVRAIAGDTAAAITEKLTGEAPAREDVDAALGQAAA